MSALSLAVRLMLVGAIAEYGQRVSAMAFVHPRPWQLAKQEQVARVVAEALSDLEAA